MKTTMLLLLLAILFTATSFGQEAELPPPVRIDSGVSGHIHPALAVTKKGTLVAVYCRSEYKPYLITRSTDGGKTWSKPTPFPHTVAQQVYPGSLTTLQDGTLVHAWNVWFDVAEKVRSRHVAYSTSVDDASPGASRRLWPRTRTRKSRASSAIPSWPSMPGAG
jgi:hypothetical protein